MNPLAKDLDNILTHTEGLWEELRGQRIFITGGTGFIGTWMLESFLWANRKMKLDAKVYVLTRNGVAFIESAPHLYDPSIVFFEGDVRSFRFPVGGFSHVIHMANERDNTDKILLMDTIVNGTKHTLEFARHCGAEKFLFMSSGAVYGKMDKLIDESDLGCHSALPLIPYAEGKRVAELMCNLYGERYGFEVKVARGFNFVGPYLPLDKNYAIGNFIGDAIGGRTIQVKGDGTPRRSYLYVADAVAWLWTILFKGKPNYPYNVGSEEEITIMELAEQVKSIVNPSGEIEVSKTANNEGYSERYVPLTFRARNGLGLEQYTSLPDAIKKTAEWYRK